MSPELFTMRLFTEVIPDTSEVADLPSGNPHTEPFLSPEKKLRNSPGAGASPPRSPVWPLLLCFDEPEDVNKNTAWFSSPGVWSTYILVVLLTWLMVQATLGCTTAEAWVAVNALHFVLTFYLFHWVKGSPFTEDQGLYDKLTWWEQMDGGRQHTMNRKFMTLVPVFLYLFVSLATRDSEHSSSLLLVNTTMVFILVIAKMPALHRIRIFGINA